MAMEPLGSQKNKVTALKVNEEILANEYENQKKKLKTALQSTIFNYQKSLEKISYFEKTALPNAKKIEQIASKQFLNGEINYLDWVLLINQSIEIQNNYIESCLQYNQNIIELNYLLNN